MKIDTIIELIEGRYNVQVATCGFTAVEEQKLAEVGEPLVQLGGEFTGSLSRPGDTDATAVDFTLPAYLRRLRSDFPIRQVFDLADSADADVQAEIWRSTMVSRVTATKTDLVAQGDPYIGETRITV